MDFKTLLEKTQPIVYNTFSNARLRNKVAQQYLITVGLFFIPLNMIFIFKNALQGMGHTFVPMMSGIYELAARSIVAFISPL